MQEGKRNIIFDGMGNRIVAVEFNCYLLTLHQSANLHEILSGNTVASQASTWPTVVEILLVHIHTIHAYLIYLRDKLRSPTGEIGNDIV